MHCYQMIFGQKKNKMVKMEKEILTVAPSQCTIMPYKYDEWWEEKVIKHEK